MIDFYEDFFDVRFLEQITSEPSLNNEDDEFERAPLLKVYDKKMLLNCMVDQFNECTQTDESKVGK